MFLILFPLHSAAGPRSMRIDCSRVPGLCLYTSLLRSYLFKGELHQALFVLKITTEKMKHSKDPKYFLLKELFF